MAEEDSRVRIVKKEFPRYGEVSLLASRAALASRAQGKYVAFHKALFASRWKPHEEKLGRSIFTVGRAFKALGKALALHQRLLASGWKFPEEKMLRIAASAGLDIDRLKEDMKDPAIDATIERNNALAESIGIHGTPGLVVGHEVRVGLPSLRVLKEMIARARS